MTNWSLLSASLHGLYREWGINDFFPADEVYLRQAFEFTEYLWLQQFNSISKLNVVMFAEAPLFGADKVYFYNPEAKFTSFFTFNDGEAFGGNHTGRHFTMHREKKEHLLDYLNTCGFLIFDIFPFALNEKHTQITYRKLSASRYHRMLEVETPGYLNPKLDLIKSKAHPDTQIIYRYKRLKSNVDDYLKRRLLEYHLIKANQEMVSIDSGNIPLNRVLLSELYQKAINGSLSQK